MTIHSIEKIAIIYMKSNIYTYSHKHDIAIFGLEYFRYSNETKKNDK